jgi:V8-like Glu-specific endopeptidase
MLTGLLVLTLPAYGGKQDPEPPPLAEVGTSRALEVVPDLHRSIEIGDERRWVEHLEHPGATFLKPHFVDVNLRAGDELRVISASGRVVEVIRGRGPKEMGTFWGLSGFGDRMTLELRFRHAYPRPPFRIDQVILGRTDLFAPPPRGGAVPESICAPADFEDVICYQNDPDKWANVLASVGVMTVGGNPNTALFCSGSNVSPRNYLLTNQHCIETQGGCDGAEFVFKFYRTGCNNGAPATVDFQSFRCDQVVAQSPFINCDSGLSDLDFTLASVIGDPTSAFGFVRPDPTPLTDGEAIYIVQHPDGRPHEIAHGSGADVDVDGTVLRYYDTLDTEGGSSGSPIFREADHQLVGLHHCGGCETTGVGNRGMLMADIHPHIEPFLCTVEVSVTGAPSSGLTEVTGNGDAVLDPGETWQFVPRVRNSSCGELATGVTATVAVNPASSPGVTLLDTAASFGDVAAGAIAPAAAPVRFRLSGSAPCGGEVIFDLVGVASTNGGSHGDHPEVQNASIGELVQTLIASEGFAAGIPPAWTVVDGGTGAGPAATWTTANPGGRSLALTAPFAIADSDELGTGQAMDEELITPVIDTSGFSQVLLQFNHHFRRFSDELADVDVRSAATAGAWVTARSYSGTDSVGAQTVDLSAWAAGQTDTQLRFHYHNAVFEWWWAVDDVQVLGNNGFVCSAAMIFEDGFEAGDTSAWSQAVP